MKASILTWYNVANHGAVLQAYALCEELRRLGVEVSFCEFERASDRPEGGKNPARLSRIIRPDFFHMLHEISHKDQLSAFKQEKRKQLDIFLSENLTICPRESLDESDVVVIGSDEVFSLETGFTPELFGFGYNCPSIFSYAASTGPTVFDDVEKYGLTSKLKEGLQRFRGISVRDRTTADFVTQLTGKTPPIVLDPVLLYGFPIEQQKIIDIDLAENVVVYSYHGRMNDAGEVSEIRKFAKKRKITSLCFYHGWCDESINLPPFEMLSAFRQAGFIVTDTFHGVVFSLITHTPFAVITRKTNYNKISSILSDLGLDNRIIQRNNSLSAIASRPIDFTKTDDIVSGMKTQSRLFLLKSL